MEGEDEARRDGKRPGVKKLNGLKAVRKTGEEKKEE